MKQLAVISFDTDADVYDGLSRLLVKHPDVTVLLPIVEYGIFAKSAVKAAFGSGNRILFFLSETAAIEEIAVVAEDITNCIDPNREIMRHIKPEDVLGIVWDESTEVHIALHALEDYGLETWNIADGLDVIEIDYSEDTPEDLQEEMMDSLRVFVENMTEYITLSVLDVLTETIAARLQEDEDNKDISPFEDDDL
jgi:hypothetical protein